MIKSKRLWAAAGVVLLLAGICVYSLLQEHKNHLYTQTTFQMDTVLEYRFYGPHGEEAAKAVQERLTQFENEVSLYLPDSQISRLNQAAGEDWVELSEDTFQLLALCKEYGQLSEGVFDVTIAPVSMEWGITTQHPQVPSQERLEELLKLVDYRDILLDDAAHSAKLARKGQAVDLGGIKGFACRLAWETAKAYGVESASLSIGGNVLAIGTKPDGTPFRVGVRDPWGTANDYMGILEMEDTTIATSGAYERYFEQDGVRYHHILDPATGYPADSDLMSVSVVSSDGAYGDFMSTYLFIKGKEFVLEHLNSYDCGLIVVDKDHRVYVSDSIKNQFTPADTSGLYQFEGYQ